RTSTSFGTGGRSGNNARPGGASNTITPRVRDMPTPAGPPTPAADPPNNPPAPPGGGRKGGSRAPGRWSVRDGAPPSPPIRRSYGARMSAAPATSATDQPKYSSTSGSGLGSVRTSPPVDASKR